MDTDADQHSRTNTAQDLATVMETGRDRMAMATAHRLATTMEAGQDRVERGQDRMAMATAHRLATTMVTDQRRVTATDTVQDLATVMDTDQRRVAYETDRDPVTTMDTDQCRVVMDMDQHPVTDAPLGRQPIRDTVMWLSRSRNRTCPRLLLVNDDTGKGPRRPKLCGIAGLCCRSAAAPHPPARRARGRARHGFDRVQLRQLPPAADMPLQMLTAG
jgi:hypothetical protein